MDKMARSTYRKLKGYNNEQMTKYIDDVFKSGFTQGYQKGIKETVEKPAVPVVEHEDFKDDQAEGYKYTCPGCGKRVKTYKDDLPLFCRFCGTKLKWDADGDKTEKTPESEQQEAEV